MAKKKKQEENLMENEAPATIQPITETLEKNYMPYAMSVIISRALPEIDGFKPSHRKLLYTMFKMGLMTGQKTKSANIVGQTMRLNPHGDAAIYETMVRLTRGHEALLHPFIDSKGSFGKQYSRDMAYAASRYTEAKLDPFCAELFTGIDKDAVDFAPNYDNTMQEPVLLPTSFPNILVSPNLGIAVGMACSICSFNLAEICDGTIALLKNPNTGTERLLDIIKAPDFPGGAEILYDREQMRRIYETGVGSFRMRAKYEFSPKEHSIDFLEIPYSSSIESIMKKATDMIKSGKLREVVDVRDAIDLNGFKLTFDLRKDADHQLVLKKLFAVTELENNFDCNFNILVNGTPRQMGVKEILTEWIRFRSDCLRREMTFDLGKKEDKLHLLTGLATILLDIDRAIKIIRGTERDEDVVPNLAKGFNLTTVQAEYIADIKLRNLNHQYILNRVAEIESLRAEIERLKDIIRDELKLKAEIIAQLQAIKKKYGKSRNTTLVENVEEKQGSKKEDIFFENYACRIAFTRGGYLKKMSIQTSRSTEEYRVKEGDFIIYSEDAENKDELFFFTDKGQIYRAYVNDFDLVKAAQMGDYVPAKLGMEEDEHVIGCKKITQIIPEDFVVYIFENGKGVRIPMSAYDSKSSRKKITGALSTDSKPGGAFYEKKGTYTQIFIRSDNGKGALVKTDKFSDKSTRTASGSQVFILSRKAKVDFATDYMECLGEDALKCRKTAIPTTGVSLAQLSFNFE